MKKWILALAIGLSTQAHGAQIQRIKIPSQTRFIWGSETEGHTNLFQHAYTGGQFSCGFNFWIPSSVLKTSFIREYDSQVLYTSLRAFNLHLIGFEAKLVPFEYSYCAEFSESGSPEDRICLREETARDQRSVFSFQFSDGEAHVDYSCSRENALNQNSPLSRNEAEEFVLRHSGVNFE